MIDKPAGWTSHDVVGWVRRWAGERKVGHAGTLDPAATGVLPVALNDGTRVLEFLTDASKAYLADITFGVATDSADIDGNVIETSLDRPALEDILAILPSFTGPIDQIPPQHSAIRINGRRAHELVRAGIVVDMPTRNVEIHALEVCSWDGETLQVHVECSKGTYIRSLARDIGSALGFPAYLSNLVRTRSGPFTLEDAWTTRELMDLGPAADWETVALHPDSALVHMPAILMTELQTVDWGFGRQIEIDGESDNQFARVYDSTGNWRGVARRINASTWSPARVIAP